MDDPNPRHMTERPPYLGAPMPHPAEPEPKDVPDLLAAIPRTDVECDSSSDPRAPDPTTVPPPTYVEDVWQEILMEIEHNRKIRLCLQAALVFAFAPSSDKRSSTFRHAQAMFSCRYDPLSSPATTGTVNDNSFTLGTMDNDGAHTSLLPVSPMGDNTAPPSYAQAQPIIPSYLANIDDHTHSAVWQADANKNFLIWLHKDVLKVSDEDACHREKDKARKQRQKACDSQAKSEAKKELNSAIALPAAASQPTRIDEKGAFQLIEGANIIQSRFPLQSIVRGGSDFVSPSRVDPESCSHSFTRNSATPATLHSECNSMVQDLVRDEQYTYVPNDIQSAQPLVDCHGKLFGVKAKQPSGNWYPTAVSNVNCLVEELQQSLRISKDSPNRYHTRGDHLRFAFGASHGGGQEHPTTMRPDWTPHNKELVMNFFCHPDVQAVAKHIWTCVQTWFPTTAAIYEKINAEVGLPRNFLDELGFNLPFAAHSFYLSPQVECLFHRDSRNYILGIFLVLPKLVLELRPGDVFLLMSSIITHGTAPLRAGETRRLWTCFMAGGIFQWYTADQKLVSNLTRQEEKEYHAKASKLFADAFAGFHTLPELQTMYRTSLEAHTSVASL
ncbi:hypothetical protein EXIGLDRAFT_763176 [Exidia glandulosa HHB12029]|uniref:Uncharacterized protein n=1 Tax=Exidia glandulosa HHB12029 TaxID=1314781 RepID=A0A165M9D2_EXIGL|nr:hypothetical protein EXIGLDRAFT_763176 [Exidia glandulosa HHB12029]